MTTTTVRPPYAANHNHTSNPWTFRGQKVNRQGHRVTKCKSINATCRYSLCTRLLSVAGCCRVAVPLIPSCSRIRLGDRVAGVSYIPYVGLGYYIFSILACFMRFASELPHEFPIITHGFSSPSVCLSVCLSVCPQYNSKTNIPKLFKLGVENMILGYPRSDTVLRFKGQRSRLQGQ